MKKTLVKMIKTSVWDGLSKANFDVEKAIPSNPLSTQFLYNRLEYSSAFQNANFILMSLKKNKESLPTNKKELEKYIDVIIAEKSGQDAIILLMGKPDSLLRDRSESQLVKELEEALRTIEKQGIEYSTSYSSLKYQLERFM